MNLYKDFAQSFSDKRWKSWNGWEKLVPYFQKSQPLEVLDLGCGNGRLLDKFKDADLEIKKYVGVDNSKELLNIAKNNYPTNDFLFINLEEENWEKEIGNKFNIIGSFGLMHHISTFEQRLNILQKSSELLKESGFLIVSFWQFKNSPDFLEKHLIEDLGDNNFILSFGDKELGATRFCHHFTDEEIEKFKRGLGIEKVDEFFSDGIENKMNKYIVWQKKS